jgi:crossover junction endodeoxyribonuclease RusA
VQEASLSSGQTTIELPWSRPPLSMNDRGRSRGAVFAKARTVREIRALIMTLARAARLPRDVAHVTVQLHYRPRDNQRRDTDNLVATLKPIADGLAKGTVTTPGYGMVPDDIPAYMAKPEPIIHPAERGKGGALWLEITWEA